MRTRAARSGCILCHREKSLKASSFASSSSAFLSIVDMSSPTDERMYLPSRGIEIGGLSGGRASKARLSVATFPRVLDLLERHRLRRLLLLHDVLDPVLYPFDQMAEYAVLPAIDARRCA